MHGHKHISNSTTNTSIQRCKYRLGLGVPPLLVASLSAAGWRDFLEALRLPAKLNTGASMGAGVAVGEEKS